MKITIEVPDIELFAKAFNNSISAYGNVCRSICFACQVPSEFEKLKTLPDEELRARYRCLLDVYRQIEQIEKANT